MRPAQLPPDDADFTGREAIVELLARSLTGRLPGQDAVRIGAVAGMCGVGKTVLAVHVAHRVKLSFPAGQLYADLLCDGAPVNPEAVLTSFLSALGTPSEALPDGLAAKSALFRSLTDGRRMLVVLDSAVDSAQIRPLIPGAADCAVLVTSREQLTGIAGARHFQLDMLTPTEAQGLLERLIGTDRVAGKDDATFELMELCGFLPLAVRIVAARLASRPGWTVREMVDRLSDERRRIDELRAGDLAVRSTFESAYSLLTAEQARALRLVASLDCREVTVSWACALLGLEERAAGKLLEGLVDLAVLESPAPGRYRLHDLMRAFVRGKHEVEGPQNAVEGRVRSLGFRLAAII